MMSDIVLPGQLSKPIWTGRGVAGLVSLLRNMAPAGAGVLVPANVCAIAATAIAWAGMRPVFHDVSDGHGNTEMPHLEAAYRPHCRVWLAVHNFGRPLPMQALLAWCRKRGLLVIEDVCNALGAMSEGEAAGSFGDAAIYSFNHGKIVDLGAGGAATTRSQRLRRVVEADITAMSPLDAEIIAAGQRLETGLRAARRRHDCVAQAKLYESYSPHALHRAAESLPPRLEAAIAGLAANVAHRRAIASIYRQTIVAPVVEHVPYDAGEAPWRHNILVPATRRDALLNHLREHGVPGSAWYPSVDRLVATDDRVDWPGASSFASRVLNLWVDQTVRPEDARTTARLIGKFFGANQ